jgi:hypothetical protein
MFERQAIILSLLCRHSCHLLSVDYFTTMALFPQEILKRALVHAVVTPALPQHRAP